MPKVGTCTYCGQQGAITRDHVPPDSIFSDPKPPNLVTVPACLPCNEAFKLDDEYFRTFVVTAGFQNRSARNLWNRKIIASPHAESIRQILRRSMKDLELRSPGGIYLGTAPAVTLDAQRILRIAARIVLGLLWHHYRVRLEPSIKIYAGRLWKLDGMETLLSACVKCSIGNDIFAYAHAVPREDVNQGVWFLEFYGGPMFFVVAVRQQQIESEWMFEIPRPCLMRKHQ